MMRLRNNAEKKHISIRCLRVLKNMNNFFFLHPEPVIAVDVGSKKDVLASKTRAPCGGEIHFGCNCRGLG
jgi:hypothetical protein